MEWPFKKALKEAIRRNRVFNGADDDQVGVIMTHGTRKQFVQNELILNEGQDTSALFLVVDGNWKSDCKVRLQILFPGVFQVSN